MPTPTINVAEKAVEHQYGIATPVQPSGPAREVGGGVTFSWGNQNTFDQYKYGEMRDGAGNLIQSGPTSDGSSFDYRYYQQQKGIAPQADKIPIVDDVISAVGEFFSGKPTPQIPFRAANIGPLAQPSQQPYDASKLYSPLSVTKSSVVPEPIIQVLTPQTTRASTPSSQPTQWSQNAIQPAVTDWSDVIGLIQAANRPRQVVKKKSSSTTPIVIAAVAVAVLVGVALVARRKK